MVIHQLSLASTLLWLSLVLAVLGGQNSEEEELPHGKEIEAVIGGGDNQVPKDDYGAVELEDEDYDQNKTVVGDTEVGSRGILGDMANGITNFFTGGAAPVVDSGDSGGLSLVRVQQHVRTLMYPDRGKPGISNDLE